MRDFMKIIMDWYLGLSICWNKHTLHTDSQWIVYLQFFNCSIFVFPLSRGFEETGSWRAAVQSSYISTDSGNWSFQRNFRVKIFFKKSNGLWQSLLSNFWATILNQRPLLLNWHLMLRLKTFTLIFARDVKAAVGPYITQITSKK